MRLMRSLNILYNLCLMWIGLVLLCVTIISGCHCVHYSCGSDTLCRIQLRVNSWVLSPWLLPFQINTLCVTPVGYLPDTLWLLPSVRDQRDLSQGWNFLCGLSFRCIASARPWSEWTDSRAGFGSSATYKKAWGENGSPWGRAGTLVDLGNLSVLCPILWAFPH